MLLRTIDRQHGLTNGTRLIVTELNAETIVCKKATGMFNWGREVALAKQWFKYGDPHRPEEVKFERLQFPVRLAYAMTINKAQGQECEYLAYNLCRHVFAHGQLVTGFSRCKNMANIRVLTSGEEPDDLPPGFYVRNVVDPSIKIYNAPAASNKRKLPKLTEYGV